MLVTLVNLSVGASVLDSQPVPLGVLYLASSLNQRGIAVEIRNYERCRDHQPFSAETFVRFLAGSGELVAISLLSNMIPVLLAWLPLFKQENPGCRIVVGGFGPSANPELLLGACPEIDFIISGWGERALCELVIALDGQVALATVAGLSYRQENGRCVHVPEASPSAIDLLPVPAHHLIETRDRHTSLPVLTARGCPHHCAFCDIPGYHHFRTEYRNLDKVLDEVVQFQDLYREDARIRYDRTGEAPRPEDLVVGIVDDTFCSRKDRVQQFCDKLGERGLELKWRVSARVDEVTPDLLDQMAQAGCDGVFFGIESGSERVLKAIGKGFDAGTAMRTVELAVSRIRTVTASFIWGVPMETLADFKESLVVMALCRSMGTQTQALLWSPLPRSRFYCEYRNKLAFSRSFVSDIAFSRADFLDMYEGQIMDHPELCSSFFHYPHPDMAERLAHLQQMGLARGISVRS